MISQRSNTRRLLFCNLLPWVRSCSDRVTLFRHNDRLRTMRLAVEFEARKLERSARTFRYHCVVDVSESTAPGSLLQETLRSDCNILDNDVITDIFYDVITVNHFSFQASQCHFRVAGDRAVELKEFGSEFQQNTADPNGRFCQPGATETFVSWILSRDVTWLSPWYYDVIAVFYVATISCQFLLSVSLVIWSRVWRLGFFLLWRHRCVSCRHNFLPISLMREFGRVITILHLIFILLSRHRCLSAAQISYR